MTREELVKQKAQEFTSSGEFSPSLTGCFIAGAEWEHKRLVHKACEWLLNNAHLYVYATTKEKRALMFDDFRKAMEE
jgi:hypothetical protein